MKRFIDTAVLVLAVFHTSASAQDFGKLFGTQIGGDDFLFTTDRDTADTLFIGFTEVDGAMNGLAYDRNSAVMYGINPGPDQLFALDLDTGLATGIGSPGALGFGNANGLAYDPNNDVLYATDNFTNSLFRIDVTSGAGTLIGSISGGFTEIEGLGYDPRTDTLYGITDLQDQVVTIDVLTAEANALPTGLPDELWRGLTYDTERRTLFASAQSSLYQIDPVSGKADFVGTMEASAVQGLGFVPSPAAATAMLVAGIFLRDRRRNRSS